METAASNALRARRPTPTHTASEPQRMGQRTPRQKPTPARHQSAYPFQPMPVSFLSDSSDDSEQPSPSQSTSQSHSQSHSHSHSHTSSQTSSHSLAHADPVSRFGIPYTRKSRPSLGTPRASFSASSDSSAPYPRTPGSQDSGAARTQWREAGVGGGGLQQDAWLAHVAEEMAASLSRLADSVRAARDELDETRAVLAARRARVLLAASGSTESWSASAFDPFHQAPRPPPVPASQSGESYYSSENTSGGPSTSPSFFTTSSISMSYSEASTAESPSYSSFYTTSPSASMSQGSFA